MKHLALAFLIAIAMGQGTIAYAQHPLIGTYTGSYEGPITFGVRLVIVSVDSGGNVRGTATVFDGTCKGTYPMEGKYAGNKLAMWDRGVGDHSDDCRFGFDVVPEGSKLVGAIKVRGWPIEMSK